jgi:hypothetical protein
MELLLMLPQPPFPNISSISSAIEMKRPRVIA